MLSNENPLLETALRGALIGLPLGYAFQRTRLCFNTAYRTALLQRDFTLVRTIALLIVVQMVGIYALAQFGVGGVQVNAVPFVWLANIVGGFIFGVAMTFAEGCSTAVWYRVGNGNLGAFVSLFGFAVGEVLTSWGVLAPFRKQLQGPHLTPPSGGIATIPNFLAISPWLLIAPIAVLAAIWVWRTPKSAYQGGWDWRRSGIAFGVIGTLAWVVAWPTGWHYGIGVVGATGQWLLAFAKGPGVLNWGSFMVATMPLGALIAAIRHGEFKWQVPDMPSTARMALAGIIMGISATLAAGCNIGHGFTGLPTLALSSITATLFTFLGAGIGVYWRFVRPQPVALRLPS